MRFSQMSSVYLHNMPVWIIRHLLKLFPFPLTFQEWDLPSDCVWGTLSSTTSAGGSEVTYSAPVGENPDS